MNRNALALVSLSLVVAACGEPPPPYEEGLPEPAPPLEAPEGQGAQVEPGEPAPEEPAPEEPAPEEPAPEEPAPEEPAPEEPSVPVDCVQVRVVDTGGVVLNVRPEPNTSQPPVTTLSPGAVVDVIDVVTGQTVNGTATWYEIDAGAETGFISGAFTSCIDPNAPTPVLEGFLLPLQCGSTVRVTQGNNSSFSHNGGSRYAFDFGLALNTPLVAVEAGRVIAVSEETQPGDPCYSGGGSGCINEANYVTIDHGDGSNSLYAHINSASVNVGDWVERGQVIALSGGTGYSTGPHAHVQRQQDCGIWWCQSIEMRFADVPGDGIPSAGDDVTSQNCP